MNVSFDAFRKRMMRSPTSIHVMKNVSKKNPKFWEQLLLMRLMPNETKREWFDEGA